MSRREQEEVQEGCVIKAASLSVYKQVSPQWAYMNPEDRPISTYESVISHMLHRGHGISETLQIPQDFF